METTTGKLFVFAAPSGAGKTTLVHALVTKHPELRFSISYTTRRPRRNEANGVDYLFVDEDDFARLREEGDHLVAEAGGLRYPVRDGIPILLVEEAEMPAGVADLEEFKRKFADLIPK